VPFFIERAIKAVYPWISANLRQKTTSFSQVMMIQQILKNRN
jgi:hypothetical protein